MAQISFRIDDNLKKNVEQICEELGMSMSTAIHIYLKKLVREGGIPFEVVADPFYSMKNMAVLDSRIADIKAGKNIVEHELIEVE
ncbi:type II toxin-antitoxin system RelB/DinJ family antitoxin [Fusobacterium necrophorum subsp. funduliforme]|nr:type II toxin-antitoxin system RelB/DinJ family antitoxin [Fusobacterium necrophorum]